MSLTDDCFNEIMCDLMKFYRHSLDVEQLEIWFDKIRHFENKHAKAAVGVITDYERFFPTPAIFKKYANEIRGRWAKQKQSGAWLNQCREWERQRGTTNLVPIKKALQDLKKGVRR